MKKLIAVFLLLVLIVPAAVSADEQDPIIGCWYMYYVSSDYAFSSNNEDMIALFILSDNHVIKNINLTFKEDGTIEKKEFIAGQWSKEEETYFFSIIEDGTKEVFLNENTLTFNLFGVSYTTNRMLHYDLFTK